MDAGRTKSHGNVAPPHRHAARLEPSSTAHVPQGPQPRKRRRWLWSVVAIAVVGLAVCALLTWRVWWAPVRTAVAAWLAGHADSAANAGGHSDDDHTAGAHSSEVPSGPGEANLLALSDQARKNIGLALATIELRAFHRSISVPGMVVPRPGRSEIAVSAPMTGIVTRVYPIRGQAVQPGEPLFDLRLTHEDLVQKQSEVLRELEELDVIKREVARLEKVTSSGAVAGKQLLEQQYEQGKREAALRADKQALLLHGLTQEQIDGIVVNRRLLQNVTVVAPAPADLRCDHQHEDFFQVAELAVSPGEQVAAGARLAVLTDHCKLYIEGKAFEQDGQALSEVVSSGAAVTAVVEAGGSATHEIADLRILYVENTIDRDSRALRFYAELPNQMVRNEATADGQRFISWRYRPGQRVQVDVPVETWKDRIVLPIEAVVQDGPDWLVFRQQGKRFARTAVHIEYRDQRSVVIANDGVLFPGDVVVVSGAYYMHLALKNKAGGAVDPHAGHNH